MKHHSIEQLQALADVHMLLPMTRTERLERWARLLEHQPDRRLGTLAGTEFAPRAERIAMRVPNSPLTVAFEDPAFRSAGLADDSYGEARRFFDLSDGQLHDIVCYCHLGDTVRGATAARRVRAAIGLWTRIRAFFA
ncbi:hypothetical protein CO731_04922 [Aminobacter sp. MSH1]|uniref:hypothetical protein n=1 Tax=Aminobacter sp. MSH1 TaxID=374606 RepID=UPI000D3481B5|nr:hypothetical protein [Aminobacter sp. MSH1]AWC25425.1 hypothetical protein CO731_04922 [Aminobacter sp. MSH1]